MSPSEEILQSIEQRLRQLHQEIAALQSARARLSPDAAADVAAGGDVDAGGADAVGGAGKRRRAARKPPGRRVRRPARASAEPATNGAGELSEEEWLARRAAELAAQSRHAAVA